MWVCGRRKLDRRLLVDGDSHPSTLRQVQVLLLLRLQDQAEPYIPTSSSPPTRHSLIEGVIPWRGPAEADSRTLPFLFWLLKV